MNRSLLLSFAALLGFSVSRGAAQEPRPLFVEGYTGAVSYAPGEELALHLSSSARQVAVEITRLGGEAKLVWKGDAQATERAVPENASSHGCLWPEAMTMKIPADWRSGYYHVTLRVRDGGGAWTQRNARTAEG